ncbi:MAG: hypothetical protein CVU84_09665 [Firmicutes bacterium HGW-Firmicutes-1]|jgi:hypothetical protein|nr:MAG: hypothetical protein CVU84_09665 [Firmicutes bacterium HGW-Firmicutes-1]
MKKFIFIDVDGTLLDAEIGIPHSTIKAIKESRKKGHKVFVCTGRAKSQVGASILDIGFDGCVFSAGSVVEVEDQTVYMDKLDAHMVATIIADLENMGIGYILEGYDYSYIDSLAADHFSVLHKEAYILDETISFLNERNIKTIEEYDSRAVINKLSFFAHNKDEILELKDRYGAKFDFMIHESKPFETISTELTLPGISKASGMDIVLDYLAASLEQTVSFGDSRNDMEMVQHANIGICMGNGIEALKQIADHVTDTLENDGIYKAFEKHGLL